MRLQEMLYLVYYSVCLVPIFNTEEESYSAYYLALDVFNDQFSTNSTALNETISTFLDSSEGSNVYYLNIGGETYRSYDRNIRATENIVFSDDNVR